MLNFHIAKLKANHQGTSISGVLREDLESFPIPVPAITEQNKITGILSAVSSVEEKANAEIENSKTLKKGLMRQLLTRGIGHKKFKKTPVGEIPATWEVMSVKALAEAMLNGGTPDTTNKTFWSGTIPWISGADFLNQKIDAYRRYITPEAVNNSTTNIVPKGALLVVTRTGVGKLAIAPVDIAISQDITGIIPKASLISAGFMFWMLNLRIGKLKANHQGTSINGILREDLESFMLPIPPLWEQEKITRILMDCDDSLRKHELCLTKLTILKKSLMKMLLTGKVRVIEYAR
jgi:type I restriction enzyme S subunit